MGCALNESAEMDLLARDVAASVDPLEYSKAEFEPLAAVDANLFLKLQMLPNNLAGFLLEVDANMVEPRGIEPLTS